MTTDDKLDRLMELSDQRDPAPWRASVEGRDYVSGDSFIRTGTDESRSEDIYVTRDSGPAGLDYLEPIAQARTYLPLLIEEIRALR